jgi:predicted transcriptional regulator
MGKYEKPALSRRERQIMDVIYMLGEATATDVIKNLPERVSDDSVRKLIRILEEKGHLGHRKAGRRYVYEPTIPAEAASRQAMKHLLKTFFHGSVPKAVSTLLDATGDQLTDEEIAAITAMIRATEKRGR